MKKTKAELKSFADRIVKDKGQYLFNIKEVAEILGISRETARGICHQIPVATVGGAKKFYIEDVINYIYE